MTQETTFKTVKVSEKGQIAIPTEIQREMKISKGDELLLMRKGNRIVLEKSDRLKERLENEFKDVTFLSEYSLRELWSYKGDDIWSRYLRKRRK